MRSKQGSKHFFCFLVGLRLLRLCCSQLTVTPSVKQSFQKDLAENFFLVTIFIPPTLLNNSLRLALQCHYKSH